jgi:hypothetical protein
VNRYLLIIFPIIFSLLIPIYLVETNYEFRAEVRELLIDFGLKEPPTRPYSESDNSPIVYHALNTKIKTIIPDKLNLNSKQIPDKLVIPSGTYTYYGNTYNLVDEGLYRFILPLEKNEQRIVFDGKNINSLMSAVAWIYSHGNSDNSKNIEELNFKALNSKIFGTCGTISIWIEDLLESNDIKSRVVQTLTLDDWNTYDNGHTMIEVYHVDLQKWILYDLDSNVYFLKNGIPLSLIEFIDVVKHDNYEIYLLATDTTLDVSNFVANNDYEYAFYGESVYANENTLKIWYKRVIQVPMISEDKFSYFTTNNVEERKQMESYASHHKFLPIDEFQSKFYDNLG